MTMPPTHPRRPGRIEPVVPSLIDDGGDGFVRDLLAEQRRIMVSGSLDAETVTSLAAQLMAFDGLSSRDVEIVINSPGGPIADIFPALDVLALMRARVNVTAIGAVRGTAVGLVAAGTGERRAATHASFCLRLDGEHTMRGAASDIAHQAEQLADLRARYLTALSTTTGQAEKTLAEECDRGAIHGAEEAQALGIVDTVTGRA